MADTHQIKAIPLDAITRFVLFLGLSKKDAVFLCFKAFYTNRWRESESIVTPAWRSIEEELLEFCVNKNLNLYRTLPHPEDYEVLELLRAVAIIDSRD